MQELATFSLETDSTVLLQYKNGQKQRVRLAELAKYALSVDIEKIRAAYRLRTSFIDTHMPKARMILMVLLGAGVLGITAVAGNQALAELTGKPVQIQPSVTRHEDVARSLAEPSVQPMVLRKPTVERVKKTVIPTHVSSNSLSKRHGKSDRAEFSSGKGSSQEGAVGSYVATLPLVAETHETPVTPAAEIIPPTPTPEASPAPSESNHPNQNPSDPVTL